MQNKPSNLNNNRPQYFNHRPFTQQNIQQFGNPRGLPPKPPQYNRPEPMDTTSNNGYNQASYQKPPIQRAFNQTNQPYRFNSYGPPKIQSKELYNISFNPYNNESDHYYQDEYYETQEWDNSYEQQESGMNEYFEENAQDQQQSIPIIEIQDEDFCLPASKDQLTDT